MRATMTLLALSLMLPACWADFPDELLEPDGPSSHDSGAADLLRDGPGHDGLSQDLRQDGPDLRQDGPDQDLQQDGSQLDAGQSDTGTVTPLKALGVSCKGAAECYSGLCVDDVCCNSSCTGKCMRCDVATKEGQCYPVTEGDDPDNECTASAANTCGLDGACDGRGGCRYWEAGTLCAPQACGGSTTDKVILARVCDGSGACIDFGEITCAPYKCNQSTKSCYDSCTSSGAAQCVSGNSCVSGKCAGSDRPPGASCALGTQCKSGHCVDGVCCDGPCSGTCETCSLSPVSSTPVPTVAGKCIKTPPGLDPDNECSPAAKHTCGLDGSCDGNGSCRQYQAGTVCQTRLCNSQATPNQLEPFHVCDGSGQCLSSGTSLSCGNYVCMNGLSCYGNCTSDAQCAPGKSCNVASLTCM